MNLTLVRMLLVGPCGRVFAVTFFQGTPAAPFIRVYKDRGVYKNVGRTVTLEY